MSLKDTAKKFGKIILIAIAGVIAGIGYVLYGITPDTKSVFSGDVSAVGQQVEDAVNTVPPSE